MCNYYPNNLIDDGIKKGPYYRPIKSVKARNNLAGKRGSYNPCLHL